MNPPPKPKRFFLAKLYLWATLRLYNEFAWAYDFVSWLVSLGKWSAWRSTALNYVRGPRVLELGFGTGTLLLEMAARDWQVCGVDLSAAMQRVTARKVRRSGLTPARIRARTQALPFQRGSFDSIVATFPAAYILAPETLHEVARLLRPADPDSGTESGRFIITGLSFESASPILNALGRLIYGGATRDSLTWYQQFATRAGFDVDVQRHDARSFHVPVLILGPHHDAEASAT